VPSGLQQAPTRRVKVDRQGRVEFGIGMLAARVSRSRASPRLVTPHDPAVIRRRILEPACDVPRDPAALHSDDLHPPRERSGVAERALERSAMQRNARVVRPDRLGSEESVIPGRRRLGGSPAPLLGAGVAFIQGALVTLAPILVQPVDVQTITRPSGQEPEQVEARGDDPAPRGNGGEVEAQERAANQRLPFRRDRGTPHLEALARPVAQIGFRVDDVVLRRRQRDLVGARRAGDRDEDQDRDEPQ
jgi:hypothetical protein